MDILTCQITGKTYTLNADATVTDSSNANVGTWSSAQQTPPTNGLLLALTNAADVAIPAQYAFSQPNNQLLVTLQNSDGSWTPQQLLNGRLLVHNNQSIGYQLVDDQGNDLPAAITVVGDLQLDGNNDLQIILAGGGVAVIDAEQVSTTANNGTGTGDDVVILAATTYDYNGALAMSADISLPGSFKPAENELVFELNGQTGVNLSFSGTFKGTSVGFEYHQGSGPATLVFTLSGTYRWDSGSATYTVYFGNSPAGFSASAALQTSATFANGRGKLEGNLTFGATGAGGYNLALSLQVQQKLDANNCIAFDVVVDGSTSAGKLSYDLGVEGTAKVAGGTLTFDAKFSSTGSTQIDLGYTGQDFTAKVSAIFGQGPPQAGVTLSVTISWQNGQRVASPVQQSAAV